MDKYEYRVKTEQMLEYMEKKQYKKAMEIADTIDWRRVKNASMLNNVSEIYEYNGEYQKSRDVLFMAYDAQGSESAHPEVQDPESPESASDGADRGPGGLQEGRICREMGL